MASSQLLAKCVIYGSIVHNNQLIVRKCLYLNLQILEEWEIVIALCGWSCASPEFKFNPRITAHVAIKQFFSVAKYAELR